VERIDKDKDGQVTDEELVLWIRHVSRRWASASGWAGVWGVVWCGVEWSWWCQLWSL